jgi:hypothetical protein
VEPVPAAHPAEAPTPAAHPAEAPTPAAHPAEAPTPAAHPAEAPTPAAHPEELPAAPGARPEERVAPAGAAEPETPVAPAEPGAPEPASPRTPEEASLLENTASKPSEELSPSEATTERAIADRGEGRPIDEPPFTIERDLPNGHKIKETPDGEFFERCTGCAVFDSDGRPRRMRTVTAEEPTPEHPEGWFEHPKTPAPEVERVPAGRRRPGAEPEPIPEPEPIVEERPAPREDIEEHIAEETASPELEPPTEVGEPPQEPLLPAEERALRAQEELPAELARRNIADDPMFEGMDPQTTQKVNTALKGDPIAKASARAQADALEWARGGSGGDPREFANRYEYARAVFDEAKAAATVRLKGTPNARANAAAAAELEITPQRLNQRVAADVEAVGGLPRAQRLQDIGVEISPEASPGQVADAVQKLDRFGFESEAAEAYHAVKHGRELPPELRTGQPVADYRAALTDTIRTGEVVLAQPMEGGSTMAVIRQTYGAGDTAVTMEALVFISPDGRVTVASYGSPKMKL